MVIRPISKTLEFSRMRTGENSREALSTGYYSLDPYINLAKKYLMIVSGYPGSGKSEWLDGVLVNMNTLHNWKTLYYSPENNPLEEHMAKLAEKFIGKQISKFSSEDNDKALEYLEHNFSWIDPEEATIEHLFALADEEKKARGLDVFVIDPWNAILHKRGHLREDEYLMEILSRILIFARRRNILVCIVAHPRTPPPDAKGNIRPATLDSISGGSMWWNKADYGVICSRPDMEKNQIAISIQKIKQKWMGSVGRSLLDYDPLSGRFKDPESELYLLPNDIVTPF
jgi:twinkle protein